MRQTDDEIRLLLAPKPRGHEASRRDGIAETHGPCIRRLNLRGIQAVVLWYPSPPGGFFGQAGLGLSRIRNSFDVGGETVRGGETGLGVTAGIGWDFPLRKGLYLTPRIASVVVPVATIDTPAGPLDNVVSTLYRFELALTFR